MLKSNESNGITAEILQGIPTAFRRLAQEKNVLREFTPGEIILGPGRNSEHIFLLISGEASVVLRDSDDERISVDTLGPGDIFGEIHFFTGIPWHSDSELVADEPCRALEISEYDFEQVMRTDPDFTVNLVKNLVRKIIRLDRSVLKIKRKRRALQSLISQREHIFPEFVTEDYIVRRLSARMEELAHSDTPVLIIGETGVGKEILAHSIFSLSHHCKEVFLQVDLLRSPGPLPFSEVPTGDAHTEQELTERQIRLFFGYEEPTRDGGINEIPGYFELSEDGTLLVRGVEKLTAVVQMKLLEAIVTETFRRHGSMSLHRAKVRLVATTRLDPPQIELERHPLLYALLEKALVIPPLRARRREIPGLVKHYLSKHSQEIGKTVPKLPKETLKALVNYSWPGNHLELATTLKRAVLVAEGGIIHPHDIYFHLKKTEGRGKFNLLRLGPIRRALMSPLFPAVLQSAGIPLFFIVLAILFLGPSDPSRNPAALFSWALGWPILIVGAFLWARFWCSLCPMGTVGEWAKKIFSLEKPFPAWLKHRSDFLMAAAALMVIWFETVTEIRNSPVVLGLLLSAMLVSAVLVSAIFERQAWCLYLCGLGGMAGVLAKTSMLELRADRNVCISQCATNECFLGTETTEGCPFGQAGPRLHSNRLCKLCTACLKSCPHGAMNLNLRIPGQELWEIRNSNTGTAFLVVSLLGGLFSEMGRKMPLYQLLTDFMPVPDVIRITLFFVATLIAVNLTLWLASAISGRFFRETVTENYTRYGLALLPLTLACFMAFHMYYLIYLGVQLPILVSQNFDFAVFTHLIVTVSPERTFLIQQIIVWTGLVWTFFVIFRVGKGSKERLSAVLSAVFPHMIAAFIFAYLQIQAMKFYFYG
ncbi:MAG: sigma 54-interacting transcriptional regulator [Desulfomonile tiedjei]|uniref:Sigma 54-interacting transcriptional regulator n=1 Tax=Desulfomonile tiedjei TaxID=2358 RepID=A0A9D6YZZ4_9BACT|nr:sigma 54-interacting transcriptional regulator [Desulfomonile tiedjei]